MGSTETLSQMSRDELGKKLYKSLFGRRYLIVLDDIWSSEAWDRVKTFFPNNNNGSRIMVTTRLSNVAFHLNGSCDILEMSFLDRDKSWNLFCKSTFGENNCPRELEDIGKTIVKNCKGLPMSIVVVGGLLAKSKQTREYWLYIARNLNSIVSLEDDERCLKILHLSYKELSVHLKLCFLYMGVYPEDWKIDVHELMRLWVAEGFLKPISGKCLEVIAQEYFNDLIGRNLILVNERGYGGETIKCKVHDLLVDVCVKQAQKHKFLCVAKRHNFNNPRDFNTQRRIVVHEGTKPEVIRALTSHHMTLVRSLTSKCSASFPKKHNSRLLRVLNWFGDEQVPKSTHMIVNCRYIYGVYYLSLPSSICSLWNLQILHVQNWEADVTTSEIWKMSQLRHVQFNELYLLDPPPNDGGDDFVLENIQTLSEVRNFKFSEEVVKRIPNIKELEVYYSGIVDWSSCCLKNLVKLINLESLRLEIGYAQEPIPSSLKELTLNGINVGWRNLGAKIGSLPNLQVLKLLDLREGLLGTEWETFEGQFCSLKYLVIYNYFDLKYWRTESWTHFPCLEHLCLDRLPNLKEIPSEIGETPKSIDMLDCSESTIISAYQVLKEQEDLGNEGLHVKVTVGKEQKQVVEILAGPNFQVQIFCK
ncbi:putative late blight resistance protein homolog r1a-6 [Phtheirospermum japonicum]|uniref:Putative late blight resistance protein homolog r1a-6 n=1 Tax=Phtheirospermum japonicum TaxID=374723 RepID=A0A830C9E6_9LAMI|nr:putative late blight resistance protein homolog r1a-6 [Phtheirospermum japonicum]